MAVGAGRTLAAVLMFALLAAGCAVAPWDAAAFDAPKRLLVALALGSALWIALWWSPRPRWQDLSGPARLLLILTAALGIGVGVSIGLSPQTWIGIDQGRWMLLLSSGLWLGASTLLAEADRRRIGVAAALVVVLNALLSLAQAAGWGPQFTLAESGGRFPTGALLGNEAYVALACALLGAAATAAWIGAGHARERWTAALLVVLCLATILVNQQRTSLIAWMVATLVLVLARYWLSGLRRLLPAVMVLAVLAVPLLREPVRTALTDPQRVAALEQATTYRIGAWAAAWQMIEARPWTGHGPGSYALQSQRYRFVAERTLQVRLRPPPTATAYANAHQDYLQLAAECGVPALIAALLAIGTLLHGLLACVEAAAREGRRDVEALGLLAILVAGAVAALAWFPLQIPLTALILLLAAGRAWRRVAALRSAP